MIVGNKAKVIYLEGIDIAKTNLTKGAVGEIEGIGKFNRDGEEDQDDLFRVRFSGNFRVTNSTGNFNDDGTYDMYRKQLEVVSDTSVSEQRYLVEKQCDGEWYPEGTGPIAYVNRVLESFSGIGTVLRISIMEAVSDGWVYV